MLFLESQKLIAACSCLHKVWRSGFQEVCDIEKCSIIRTVQEVVWKNISRLVNSKLAVWSRKFD